MLHTTIDFDRPGKQQGFLQVPYSHNLGGWANVMIPITVVAFTAAQIPGIDDRRYPAALAGEAYPDGVPIRPESELAALIERHDVSEVILAYSDLSHEEVMHKASLALAAGADFRLMGPQTTMLRSRRPVIAVCAVRTGCGKSQTSRHVGSLLLENGLRVALVRHPMPYGDLVAQRVQRFATLADIDAASPTVEEREEYEAPVAMGIVTYAGVDYAAILAQAEEEADVVIWDGGNNDLPFYETDLHLCIADPHRAGHDHGRKVDKQCAVGDVRRHIIAAFAGDRNDLDAGVDAAGDAGLDDAGVGAVEVELVGLAAGVNGEQRGQVGHDAQAVEQCEGPGQPREATRAGNGERGVQRGRVHGVLRCSMTSL